MPKIYLAQTGANLLSGCYATSADYIEEIAKNEKDSNSTSKLPLQKVLSGALHLMCAYPILLVYPFFQRYFVKGVMLGSIKA